MVGSLAVHAAAVLVATSLGARPGAPVGSGLGPAHQGDPSAALQQEETEVLAAAEEAPRDDLAGRAAAVGAPDEAAAPALETAALPAQPNAPSQAPIVRSPSKAAAPSGPPRGPATSAPRSAASGTSSSDGPATSTDDGHARRAPDLASRFTKELPRYASGVEAWSELADGATSRVRVSIALDDRGKVVAKRDPIPEHPAPPAALAESVRRTVGALIATFALPGHPVRSGVLVLEVSARVAHGAPRPDIEKYRLETTFMEAKGDALFELESGLLVTFEVKVESVTVE